MIGLFYDTETQHLPLFSQRSEDPGQPHIVQLAAALVDLESRQTIASLDLIARPDGWTIPDSVAAIHGITTERATAVGVDERLLLDGILGLWARADVRIAHNESFDARIIRIAMMRFGHGEEAADAWKVGRAECTARLATSICKLPPTAKMRAAGRHHPKTPNLAEAYRHFTGNDLENAHTALADVNACMAVYFAAQASTEQGVSC